MLKLDARTHHVRKVPLSEWLRREFPDHPLFVFWNDHSRVWEIGEWAGDGLCYERCIIGSRLQAFDRQMVKQLKYELSPRMASDIHRMRRASGSKAHQQQSRVMEETRDSEGFYRWLNNKLGHKSHPVIRTMAGLAPE